jgi:two-component system repressor protein LuxO
MEKQVPRLLLVEDRLSIARCYREFLSTEGCEITHVDNGIEAIKALTEFSFAVVLLDLQLPDIDGYIVLDHINEHKLSCEVVVITAHGSYEVSKRVISMGATDYLEKPFSADRLRVTVRNALSRQKLSKDIDRFRNGFGNFIGSSVVMQSVYRIIESAATSKASVFITGESGTGKEVCAEALHNFSDRRDRRCVTLNCAAIPRDLMESEIFGHVKGAFTGAVANHEGAASQADGGTLFLDEIGEMDLGLQSKFLRLIQTGQFQKVGSNKLETVDIRFVAATNRDPLQQISDGSFRGDLYYRLNVIPIHMPPLRDRGEDIIDISKRYLIKYADEEGKAFNRFSSDARELLLNFPWPGNVRQLLNVLHNAVILNEGELITADMLPITLSKADKTVPEPDVSIAQKAAMPPPPKTVENGSRIITDDNPTVKKVVLPHHVPQNLDDIRPLWQVEMETIERAIELCSGNVTHAAKLLEVSPSTIYRKKPNWKQQGKSLGH